MEKILVGQLADLAPRMGKEVIVGEQKIAVFRLSDDRIKAIENVCPHKQGPLAEGTVSGEYVFCPLHDYKINLNDGQVQEPDEGCVRSYETIVEADLVYIMV
ncbi:nitrite reductase [NAD(P)H], small subunit [Enterococcus sp. 7E2_DIV0204]|uniref:nitrite reductase small subunit NirD n=1 Tax=unclassified Enterococcus TaxID=2608891 RepID=UPI000A33A4CD|nr:MULTISPECIES: nitrite reductase small subunit NirD [unclassified Enterococcus]OTN89373.1 nitrite reductase [NAD(P)H], small subunit [Enterococcus sp. 7E2_DIV0204]OTP51827.1 nitrite reductase [NAD(P)H], small subunit [Enterococcus sp. 7D2_DIV0200]